MAFHLRRVANFEGVTKTRSVLCLLGSFRRSFCSNSSTMNVADLSDAYSDTLQYVEPNLFRNYGGKTKFGGMISTLKVHEDNLLVKQALSEPGNKRVLVVDGGGSLRHGMLGDILAGLAMKNNWAGVVMYCSIRDSEEIAKMAIGVKAIGTMPLRSVKKGQGERDIPVRFGGVTFTPGHYIYSDLDGIIVSPKELTLEPPKL
ncbi:putative 4-hydroxy-4-methyl-2-oxoglutarate aldolase [Oculina patagonica]